MLVYYCSECGTEGEFRTLSRGDCYAIKACKHGHNIRSKSVIDVECPQCPLARQARKTCRSDYHLKNGVLLPMRYPKGKP